MGDEAAIEAAVRQRLVALRQAREQAIAAVLRIEGGIAELEMMLSGFVPAASPVASEAVVNGVTEDRP